MQFKLLTVNKVGFVAEDLVSRKSQHKH